MKKIFTFFSAAVMLATVSLAQSVDYTELNVDSKINFRQTDFCPEGSVYYNEPNGGNAFTSTTDNDIVNYQTIEGLEEGTQITEIIFWGLQAFHDGSGWAECSSDEMDMAVGFYEAGAEPGDEIYSEVVTATAETITDVEFGSWTVKKFTVVLSEPVVITDGWFSVASTNNESCWLLGISSNTGNGETWYLSGGEWIQRTDQETSEPLNISFCLVGTTGGSTSVEELISENAFVIFPNPASTNIEVVSEQLINEISIFDIAGRMVYNNKIGQLNADISVENFKPGIYFMQISGENSVETRKIQIVK